MSSITTKRFYSPMQWFFCKLVQRFNFGRLKSANGHFWIDYFQIWGNSPKSISRIWWELFRSPITTKTFCSPLLCFFCKLVQMSNFWSVKIIKCWIPKIYCWSHFILSIQVTIYSGCGQTAHLLHLVNAKNALARLQGFYFFFAY